jgi:hypothetical protein
MNQREFNFLNMTDSVMSHMLIGKLLWENNPEIVEVVEAIKQRRNDITVKGAVEAGLSGKGHTSAKDNTLDTLATLTCKLSKKISGYAKKKSLLELIPLVNVSVSTISRGPEKEVINRCSAIADIAVKHLENLASFNVKTDEIEQIEKLISEYQNHIDNRSNTNISKSSSGVDIADDIGEIRHQLDILDDLVEGSLEDNPFIREYQATRLIDDYGKGKTLKNKDEE